MTRCDKQSAPQPPSGLPHESVERCRMTRGGPLRPLRAHLKGTRLATGWLGRQGGRAHALRLAALAGCCAALPCRSAWSCAPQRPTNAPHPSRSPHQLRWRSGAAGHSAGRRLCWRGEQHPRGAGGPGLGARLEELADHARALAHVLLHQLAADDADEAGVGAVGHRARQQRLARACRARRPP